LFQDPYLIIASLQAIQELSKGRAMIKLLMIGSFLSEKTGTKGISEKLMESLKNSDLKFIRASDKKNKIIRYWEIILKCIFSSYRTIHIDTFSGRAFKIAEIASSIGNFRRKRIIMTLRGGKLPEFYNKYPQRIKKALTKGDCIQTPSLYLKDFFAKQNIHLQYLPNSIELDRFPYDRNNVKPYTLLWVRAFSKVYNPDLAVRTLYEVQKVFPDTTLTMIGPDKGVLNEIRGLINELNLESSVNIIGPVKNENLYLYYQTHSVFLNTTSYESFGVAVLEAAACGIPIVSTKVGEIPFLWQHEKNMLLVENFEFSAFSYEVLRLFKSKELADRISKNARRKAENFNWETIKPKWIDLLN